MVEPVVTSTDEAARYHMLECTVTKIDTSIVNATERTNWFFVHVTTADGGQGTGEATLGSFESAIDGNLDYVRRLLIGQPLTTPPACYHTYLRPSAPGGILYAAALSAVEQALWHVVGMRVGLPVSELVGGRRRDRVRAYANINRSLIGDRSAVAFAAAARKACEAGFTAIKCAPFDGVVRQPLEERADRGCIYAGLDRVEAVRDAIGPDIDLLIDCAWRFDARTASRVLQRLAGFDPYWVEAPVSEHDLDAWRAVRRKTELRLAGGEMFTGLAAYREFIERAGVDVVMPDLKYSGGIDGVRKISAIAESYGVQVAPHNPSGPVATLASLQLAATLADVPIIEYAWGEAEWRADLVQGAERFEDGALVVANGPGLGGSFDFDVAGRHPGREVELMGLDICL